ncbi:hypothetical protein GLOTRDRAFT_135286 [Gloeophyllum trabeum ATCC 11539]|uniref:DUF803-domain-containing protein n=1 Tax=Gloeophyllum trabeum (strain ATCC 11539 / FP-39264 / Madison 617) TaxID=670483 RepID=S7QM43_GLOTA|nr:uncharacterized protein GLOTRDRAFT_135286 [Gloeophyllum trabeum ATCC 11539]EPQ60636.1 hypothetical protein GLOTRDRAFT_135286 [Gloeophyllum trabeum ATCC 11539]
MHAAEHGEPSISIPVGIVIGLLASCVQSLGLTIQRKSHVLNQALPDGEQRVEHRRPLWLLGFAIFISSNILGSLFQIASLPVVILAPLGAVSLLWNAFFARFLLGDVFSPWMILGTLLIAGGAVLIAIFGIVPEPTHSLEDLLQLFRRPAFVAYFSILGFIVVACLIITHIVEYSYTRRRGQIALPETPPLSPTLLPTDAVTTQVVTERTPLVDRKRHSSSRSIASSSSSQSPPPKSKADRRTALILAVSYASMSGILSGMCLIFAKSGVELLMLTLKGHNQFWRWEAWMLLIGLGVFALLQLWYLHKSLVLADPTLVCPLAFCFYNLSSIVNGLVYYDQFSLLSTLQLLLVSLGIVVLLAGVWVVSVYAGAGGVDVGTWNEEDEPLEEIQSEGVPEEQRSLLGDVVVEEPDADALAQSVEIRPDHARIHTDSLVLRSPSLLLSPPRRSRRVPSHSPACPDIHATTHTYPLSPPLPVPSFSIGLSPVSPGFTVVPRERRRRVSGMGSISGDSARAVAMRRSVSDGDASVRSRSTEDAMSGGEEARPGGRHDGLGDDERGEHGRSRWRWLRGIIPRKS